MIRKDYEKPMVITINLKQSQQLLSGSPQGSLPDSQDPINDEWDDY